MHTFVISLLRSSSHCTKGKRLGTFHLAGGRGSLMSIVSRGISYSVSGGASMVAVAIASRSPLVYTLLASAMDTHLRSFVATCEAGGTHVSVRCCRHLARRTGTRCRGSLLRCKHCTSTGVGLAVRDSGLGLARLRGRVRVGFGACATVDARLRTTGTGIRRHAPTFAILRYTAIPIGTTKPGHMCFILNVLVLTFVKAIICVLGSSFVERLGNWYSKYRPTSGDRCDYPVYGISCWCETFIVFRAFSVKYACSVEL